MDEECEGNYERATMSTAPTLPGRSYTPDVESTAQINKTVEVEVSAANGVSTAFRSLDELYRNKGQNCQFCNVATVATRAHLQKVHLKFAVSFSEEEVDYFCIPCHCQKLVAERSHWHCPKCQSILRRKHYFEKHLQRHGLSLLATGSFKDLSSEKDQAEEDTIKHQEKTFQCPQCTSCYTTAAKLRKHVFEKHKTPTEPVFLVDEEKGIFITAQEKTGPRTIIHICKSFSRQVIDCEVDTCREFMSMATGRECMHLKRLHDFRSQEPPHLINNTSIEDMYQKGLISASTKMECNKLNQQATQEGTTCVYPVFYEEHGYSGRKINFSVFTGRTDSWCQFGRTTVTLDTVSGKWTCRCKGSKKYKCVHVCVSQCWTYQERRHLLQGQDIEFSSDTDDDLDTEDPEPGQFQNITSLQIKKIVEYMWNNKKLPPTLPLNLKNTPPTIPMKLSPEEATCPYCPGPTPPDLGEEKIVSKDGTVYGILTVQKGVHVYIKHCPVCNIPVRFQNYLTGIHNYNNRVFITIQLCAFLTNLLKTHTAIGRFIAAMEEQLEITIHHNTIRRAFFHFSALTHYQYDFFCYKCGHDPPVAIADANWKLSFDVPVSLLKRPAPEKIKDEDLSVNITEKWDRLEKEIIAAGICEDLRTHNPYTQDLTHSSFVPWIGPASRSGDVLPKTEILKGLTKRPSTDTRSRKGPCVDEDQLLQLMEAKKPSKSELIKACIDLGVPSEGSETDLINQLQEMLLYKDIYPKMFAKLQRTGGGVLHMGCTHSVVYYCSPLLWQESARDHADGLLSFANPPTVYISDIAGRVARHTNNRTQQKFFQPHDGRLCEPAKENIQAAQQKKLKLEMPWAKKLRFKHYNTDQQITDSSRDPLNKPHPITGTSQRYSLYDRFHQKNQTRPEEQLRSLNLVPELCSYVNSSEAEQKNRELSFDRYFLCQLKDTHFMFCLRLVFHLHNEMINQKFKTNMEKQTNENLEIGANGRLILPTAVFSSKRKLSDALEGEQAEQRSPQRTTPQNDFSLEKFHIHHTNKEKLAEMYRAGRTDYAIVKVDGALLYHGDMESLCPEALLNDDVYTGLPWLTDDVVNTRVSQLAQNLHNVFALHTYHFTMWWRSLMYEKTLASRHLKCIEGVKKDSTVLLPRTVGHQTPETGNHFILWVLDGSHREIRVYDSLQLYTEISHGDMEILCKVFQDVWNLREWHVVYPAQWKQRDGVNCGVFVCTAAELDVKGTAMSNEPLNEVQLGHLRIYHAAHLMHDATAQAEKLMDSCMAEDFHACTYYDASSRGQKRRLYPQVTKEDWFKCETCNGWLHKDCANYNEKHSEFFSCGCILPEKYTFTSTLTCLLNEGVEGLITRQRILEIKKMLDSGERKSNRMYLWMNPGTHNSLKQILLQRPTCFSEDHMTALLELLKSTLPLDFSVLRNAEFIIDVMLPEATIDILMRHEGFPRIHAEKFLGRIIDEDSGC